MTQLMLGAFTSDDDPVNPGLDRPTSLDVVAALSPADRALRVRNLTTQATTILDLALAEHLEGRTLLATCLLYSGGNDSTVLTHMLRGRADYALHADTGIGIAQTRDFVRETCAAWDLPLIVRASPGQTYRDLVLERGFPGPAMHWKMYQRLKERALDAIRAELLAPVSARTHRLLWIAGRRRDESQRRADVPLHERDGSVIWASPLAMWTKLDLNTYRQLHPAVPQNPVSALLHMSGECLCGAFAHPGELDEIGTFFPEVRAHIEALEAEVRAAGHPEPICRWGHGEGRTTSDPVGKLCSSCLAPDDAPLFTYVEGARL